MQNSSLPKKIAIIGGGLAGLAAATVLAERNFHVEIFEAKRQLGGRAGSFLDATAEEMIDHCQHVGMGCCTNLVDFCRRTGIDRFFQRHRVLHFFGPDGRRYDLQGSRWLPAPLHLASSLLKLGFITLRERLGVARAMLRLARLPVNKKLYNSTIGEWLRCQGQSQQVINRFWAIVLVSALGESLEHASLAAARKVFVDGFLSHTDAYQVDIPNVTLAELYDRRVAEYLRHKGVTIHLGRQAMQITGDTDKATGIEFANSNSFDCDAVIVSVPWQRAADLFSMWPKETVPELQTTAQIESAPITGVHLWFDRAITPLPHAVLIDRLSQWFFNRGKQKLGLSAEGQRSEDAHCYQVVISASRELVGREHEDILEEILSDLQSTWPLTRQAKLLHWRIVTQREAVFSVRPGVEQLRPSQKTAIDNIFLAGDWTQTGWPATMEGAVQSGYLAGEALLKSIGEEERILVADLPRGWLARKLIGTAQ